MIATLKVNNLYDESHPYLVEASPFFLNRTHSEVLEVTEARHLERSNFLETDMVFEELH